MSKQEVYTTGAGTKIAKCKGCGGMFRIDGLTRGKCIVCAPNKPQPKKKNPYSFSPTALTFKGNEIHTVFIGNTTGNGKLGCIITLKDGATINFYDIGRQKLSKRGDGIGVAINAQSMLAFLIGQYVD